MNFSVPRQFGRGAELAVRPHARCTISVLLAATMTFAAAGSAIAQEPDGFKDAVGLFDTWTANRVVNRGQLSVAVGAASDDSAELNRKVDQLFAAYDKRDTPGCASAQAFQALIFARTGETDRAIAEIERLLTTPFTVDYADESITLSDLRTRWEWDPLRNDPRFQKIVAGPEPKTIYK